MGDKGFGSSPAEGILQPALYFFYKGFGNVKGMLYLCIVMMIKSVVPQLKENKKFVRHFNKMMKDKVVTCMGTNYGVIGYPQLKVTDNEVVLKLYVTKGFVKYYKHNHFTDVVKGDSVYRRVTSRVKNGLGKELYNRYLKHLGLRNHEIKISLSWV